MPVTTQAAAVREQMLTLVRDGMKVTDAIKAVGRNRPWYEKTRERHPQWAQQITQLRLEAEDPDLPGMSFVDFRKTYFDNYTAPHHYRMIEAFETAQPGSVSAVLAFPGAGKTTTLADKYCHLLAENPNTRICVISEGQDLSRKIIGQVSDRMSDRERFLAYHLRYGPFRIQRWDDNNREDRDAIKRPWTADYFRILAADADQKEPSLESRGATGRLYGGRYDWMVFDDVQSNETIANTSKLLQSMRTTWKSRTILGDGQHGRMLMIGSRVGAGDIYEVMEDQGMFDTIITIPALTLNIPADEHYTIINKKIVVNPDCPASPTWPQMSLQTLAEIRQFVKEEAWARTYMQDLKAETGAVFTEEMIEKAKDPTRTLGPSPIGTDIWASLDPALDSGICAYMVAALSAEKLSILDCMGRTDTHTYSDTFDWMNTWSSRYRPTRWIVEENNYQKGLLQDDRLQTIAKRWGFQVQPHRTGRNKNDPIMGIRMMANAFADGEISIPWGDDATREAMAPLIHELRTWKPHVRGSALRMDRVVTLWFMWMRWQAERQLFQPRVYRMPRPSWLQSA